MNETLKRTTKNMIKDLLSQCDDAQKGMFRRMYCPGRLELSLNEAVDLLRDDQLDHAFTQVERTVENNNRTHLD